MRQTSDRQRVTQSDHDGALASGGCVVARRHDGENVHAGLGSTTSQARRERRRWQSALTVSACLTTLILSGCATNPGGRPELATHIPDACERLAVRVAHPRYKKGTDVRIVLAKYAAVGGALDQANASWMQFVSAAGYSVSSLEQGDLFESQQPVRRYVDDLVAVICCSRILLQNLTLTRFRRARLMR